jgi:GTP-binding protein HflX
MSQQGAGIGTRGPGETRLEVDRRRIMRRITKLEHDLKDLQRTRQLQRKSRSRSGLSSVVIVGYTNAGKSTLLNSLTKAGVLTENRLFATLDPTTRRLALPGGEPVLLTDTVGFVRKLPHGLIEAFKSTLEVAGEADMLIHVVDASAQYPDHQIDAVREVLTEINADQVPEFIVFNKSDLAEDAVPDLLRDYEGSVAVSALTGEGLDVLLRTIGDRIRSLAKVTELVIPFDRGDVLASVHREGEVVSTEEAEGGMRIRARLSEASVGRLREFVVSDAWGQG